ncbi:MAG TPA: hypothetical protein VFB50_05345 [Chloroflexota bacterium]|nr:hypothetical protein [Chloroflexota bacterium]
MAAHSLSPAEFCQLERQLVERMAMRKKRNVQMAPMQRLKIALCQHVETINPDGAHFNAALAEAVLAVSPDQGTGPAQAVASDLQMDWDLARTSEGFVTWLRQAATAEAPRRGSTT